MLIIEFLTRPVEPLALLDLVNRDNLSIRQYRMLKSVDNFMTDQYHSLTSAYRWPPELYHILHNPTLSTYLGLNDIPSMLPNATPVDVGREETTRVNLVAVRFLRWTDVLTFPWEKMLDLFLRFQALDAVRFQCRNSNDLLGFVEAQRSTLGRNGLLVFSEIKTSGFFSDMFYVDLKVMKDLL
jgi:hypothetical protein